jgi:hypothetical protein
MVPDDEILDEYSLDGAVRGKYDDRFPPDSKLVPIKERQSHTEAQRHREKRSLSVSVPLCEPAV